jgi:uncharacterized protein (TIGR02147 family)
MNAFDFKNYKIFVNTRIQAMPRRGHGQYRRMANFLSVNSVYVSQVFRGTRELNVEQACELVEFFGLSELEGQYFIGLVERERAGTQKLKAVIQKRLDALREKSQDLKQRLKQEKQLTDETKAFFYSNWYYSGIRLLTSIPGYQSPDAIAEKFGLPLSLVNRVLEFLVQTGLCAIEKDRYVFGPKSTHLEASSPLVTRHHMNWRVKGMERMGNISAHELFLSLPCSISEKAMIDIREELVKSIERITAHIDAAPEEQLACLNIDFFKF